MKKILFCLPLLLLALQSCEIEDEYMYDKGLYTIDWDAAADSSSVTLIDRFWNTEENYFNYGNDGSIKDFHYWPQAHAMDVMIDAYNRTGDSKYSDLFDKWYVGIKAKNGGSYWNNFYDDMEWIALTMIRLYEVTDENKYLETSQEMWNEIKTGWNDYAGGGIAWTHDRLWSKNACSNGPAALIAARLYRINGNQEDLDWAVNIYKWERENLFNPATGAIYDNVNGETGELSTLSLSYNQGTFLGAAYELYKITGEESYTIAIQGIDHLWVVMVQKDAIFIDLLQFVPLLIGILLAAVQFFPEMQRKCLKLTLHLPYSQKKMVMSMLAYGVLALVTCFAMSFIMMGVYLPQHFTSELVQRVLLSAAPWFFAGFAGYLLVSWICLEPTWKRRVLNLIIAALIFRVYFLAPGAEAYNSFLPCLTLYTLLAASLSWISVVRFKAGKQD